MLIVKLVYCDVHRFNIKETLDSCFDCSIESRASSLVGEHIQFVYSGFLMNL